MTGPDIIGVEEILLAKKRKREQTLKVVSDTAFVLFMTKQNFKEQLLKFGSLRHDLSKGLEETYTFYNK